jgi:hypothetical protein
MKTTFLVCLLLFFFIPELGAQYFKPDNDSLRKKYGKQLYFGFGATQFLGDLGGGDGPGKTIGMGDMDMKATDFQVHVGFRYHFHPRFATSTNLYYGKYNASDHYTLHPRRSAREISIKSIIIELSQRFEFIFYSYYNAKKGVKKTKVNRFEAYAFTGIGLTYFNPRAGNSKYEGVFLKPLSTEGQAFKGGAEPYNLYTAVIPFGFGAQKSFTRKSSIRLEVSYMKTFTDYMDDVSTNYYSFKANNSAVSQEAIYCSNPSEDWEMFKHGDPRGGPGKDCYFYAGISFVKALGLNRKKYTPKIIEY